MKDLFKVNTRTIVATALGAALFAVLFMFVKIPTPVPETQIQSAYGVGGFFAALFGPICGFLLAFIGHAISDATQYGSVWWSWVIASGFSCCAVGFIKNRLHVEEGVFGAKDLLTYNIGQIVANAFAWVIIAPVLDIVVYSEPVNLVFTQGAVAAISNAVSMGVIGSILLLLYSKTRAGKGSLNAED